MILRRSGSKSAFKKLFLRSVGHWLGRPQGQTKTKRKSIASGSGKAADPMAPASNIEVVAVEESMAADAGPDGESIPPCPEHGPEAVPIPKKRQPTLTGFFKKPS